MDEDFERHREVRRQKREEMQKEAEKVSYSKFDDDDDEEAARERRRRARQERLRNMENEEISSTAPELNSTNSVTDTSFSALISTPATNDDDQALLERLAKREERRQRRMKEAMERQKEFDPTVVDGDTNIDTNIDTPASEDRPTRGSPLRAKEEESPLNSWREKEEKTDEEKIEAQEEVQVPVAVKEETLLVKAEAVLTTAPEDKDDDEEDKKPQTSHLTEQESIEEKNKETVSKSEEEAEDYAVSTKKVAEEKPEASLERADLEQKDLKGEGLLPKAERQAEPVKEEPTVEAAFKEECVKYKEENPVKDVEEPSKKPEEKLAALKVPVRNEPLMEKNEEEKPHIPEKAEEKPHRSKKEVDVRDELSKKEAEKKPPIKVQEKAPPQKKIEDKPVISKKDTGQKPVGFKKEVEEKTLVSKKEGEEKPKWKKEVEEKPKAKLEEIFHPKEVMEEKPKLSFLRDKKDPGKQQTADDVSAKVKKPEKQEGRLGLRSPEVQKQGPLVKPEAERKLVELKRLRNQTEREEFEKMKQKQQSAEAELEELKRKREERKKVLEEEDKQNQQQQAEKRVKEEQERQKMREEIERRRAEAAEKKRQKEESSEGSKAPFKCMSPKGASTKIGEKAEFLSKSAQKTPMKVLHTPLVCKIGNRLEQYTSAVQTKDVKSPKSPVKDLPVVEGVRNIKSLWEKGNVQSCAAPNPATTAAAPKEAAGINVGVASRINSWKTKTPETKTPETKIPETKAAEMKPTETKALDARAPAEKPAGGKAELKPADVSKTRGLWDTKSPAPAKVFAVKTRSVANGTRK